MESYNNIIQIVLWKTWNLLMWAGLKQVTFSGLRATPDIHVNIMVYKICRLDLGTFNVHVLGSNIFTEIYTRTLNDIFHAVVKNK